MKILFVITKGNWGGAQKYVYELATSLPKNSFDITVLHGAGDVLPEKLAKAEIKTIRLPQLGRDVSVMKDAGSFFSLLKIFRREKPDVVHLNSSKIGGLGALAARLAGVKKIIFTVHGFAFNETRPSLQKFLIRFLSWLTIILSTDVICISKKEYDEAGKWLFAKNKLGIIHNGISAPDFYEKQEARKILSREMGRPEKFLENKKIVGSIGELTKNKGYPFGISAFALQELKNIPELTYIIIGAGEQQEELRTLIEKNNLEEKVFLAGFVQDASKLLKAFDIFLLCSVKEGLPYVLLEAGLADVPIVAANVGAVSEIVENNKTGLLLQAGSNLEISRAIIETLSNQDRALAYAKALENKTKKEFGKEKMMEETEKVYRK